MDETSSTTTTATASSGYEQTGVYGSSGKSTTTSDACDRDSSRATTTAEPGSTAYVRVAYGNLDSWDSTPTSRYFAGTLDDATCFPAALIAAQVRTLYE